MKNLDIFLKQIHQNNYRIITRSLDLMNTLKTSTNYSLWSVSTIFIEQGKYVFLKTDNSLWKSYIVIAEDKHGYYSIFKVKKSGEIEETKNGNYLYEISDEIDSILEIKTKKEKMTFLDYLLH